MAPSPPLPMGADSHTLSRWRSTSRSRNRSRQTYAEFIAEAAAVDAALSRATTPIPPSLIGSIPLTQKRNIRRWKQTWWALLALTPLLLVSSTAAFIYLAQSVAAGNVNPNYITWVIVSSSFLLFSFAGLYMLWWNRRHRRRMEANWARLEIQKWRRDGRERAREAERAEQLVDRLREGLRTRSHSRGTEGRSVSRGRRKRHGRMEDEEFGETNVGVSGTTEQDCRDDKKLGSNIEVKNIEEKAPDVQGTTTESTAVNSSEGPALAPLREQQHLANEERDIELRNPGRQSPVYEKQDGKDSPTWWSEASKPGKPQIASIAPLPKRISSLAYAASHRRGLSNTSSSRPSMPDTMVSRKSLSSSPGDFQGPEPRSPSPRKDLRNNQPSASSQAQTFPNAPWADHPGTTEYMVGEVSETSPVSNNSSDMIPSGVTSLYRRVLGESVWQSKSNQSPMPETQTSTSHSSDLSPRRDTLGSTNITREGHGDMGSMQSDDNFLAANELEEDAVSYDSGEVELRKTRSKGRVGPWLEGHEESYEKIEDEDRQGEETSSGHRRRRLKDALRSMSFRARTEGSGDWKKDENGHWQRVKEGPSDE